MKKIFLNYKVLLISICITLTNLLVFSQNLSEGYIYVEIESETAKAIGADIYTNNENLNELFNHYKVISYYESFPNAKNNELMHIWEIHFNGNAQSFKEALNATKLFKNVVISDYYHIESCDNPVQINDPYIVNGWVNNYALELLHAACAWTITTGSPDIIV